MADTTAPAPTWLQVLQGFLPSLNQSLVIIVSAVVGIGSTLATQKYLAPKPVMVIPAADKPAPMPLEKYITAATEDIIRQVREVGGTAGVCVEEIQSLRLDWKPHPRAKAKPAASK